MPDFWNWFLNRAISLDIETEDIAEMISEIADYGANQRSIGIALGKESGKNGNPEPF